MASIDFWVSWKNKISFSLLLGTEDSSRIRRLGHWPLPCMQIEFSPVYSPWGKTWEIREWAEQSAGKRSGLSSTEICPWRFLGWWMDVARRRRGLEPSGCFGVPKAATKSNAVRATPGTEPDLQILNSSCPNTVGCFIALLKNVMS